MHVAGAIGVMTHEAQQLARGLVFRDRIGHRTQGHEGIAAENFILYPEFPRPSYADFVLNLIEQQGLEAKSRVFTMDLQTALSLVAIGEGMCIVPESVSTAPRNGIHFHRLDPELGTTALSINHRVDDQGVHVHKFTKIAQEVARKAG